MTPVRVALSAEEAAVVQAALLYWRDTYLQDPEAETTVEDDAEAARLSFVSNRIRGRIHKALRRRGYPVILDE